MRSLIAVTFVALSLSMASVAAAQTDMPAAPSTEPAAETVPQPAEAAPAAEAAPSDAAPAAAAEPAYVGTWSEDSAQCGVAQEMDNAPMVIAKDRFDQHEAHCEFTSVSGNGNEWKVSSKCSVEGDEQAYDFGMSLADDKLTMLDDAGSHVYTRCP